MDRKVGSGSGGGFPSGGGRGRGRSQPIPIRGRGRGCGTKACPVLVSSGDSSSFLATSLGGSDESGSPAGFVGTQGLFSATGGAIKPGPIPPVRRGRASSTPPTVLRRPAIPTPPTLGSVSVPYGTSPQYVGDGIFKFVFVGDQPRMSACAPRMIIVLGAEDFQLCGGGGGSFKLNNTKCTVSFPVGGYAYVLAGGQIWYQCGEEKICSVDAPEGGCIVDVPCGACVSFGSSVDDFEELGLNEADVTDLCPGIEMD